MNRKELKSKAKEQLKENNNYWKMTFIVFIYLVIVGFGNWLSDRTGGATRQLINLIYTIVLAYPLSISVVYVAYKVARNKECSIKNLGYFTKIYGKAVGIKVLLMVFISIGFILFIIPGIIVSLRLSQAEFILVDDNSKGIIQCLKESNQMMKGHCWEYFVLTLSFILWYIVGVITICIGFIFIMSYINTTLANYYLNKLLNNYFLQFQHLKISLKIINSKGIFLFLYYLFSYYIHLLNMTSKPT